jgi:hypothetical protein
MQLTNENTAMFGNANYDIDGKRQDILWYDGGKGALYKSLYGKETCI